MKKIKILKWIIITAAIVEAGAIVTVLAIINNPSRRLSKLLDLGNRYLEACEYEQAIAAYDGVLTIDPNCVEAYIGEADAYVALEDYENAVAAYDSALEIDPNQSEVIEREINAYIDWSEVLVVAEDYENAITAYDSALEINPNLEEAIQGEINAYLAWSDILVAEEDFDEALFILNEGYSKFDDNRLLQAIERTETIRDVANIHDDIIGLIYEAAEVCEEGDYLAVAEMLADNVDILSKMNEAGVDRYLYDDLSVCSAGIYIIGDGYYLYVGDYENDNREGNGTWISIYHIDYDGFAYAVGEWSDDAPNGQQVVTTHQGEIAAEVNFTRGIEGNVIDGLWDGHVTWFFGDNIKFQMDYNDGYVKVISIDEDDPDENYRYHVAESLSADEKDLYFGEDDINETWGVPGYADEW